MNNPVWDMPLSKAAFKKVLKNPRDKRFLPFLARTLSWVPFYDVFREYITPAQFKKYFPRVRREIDTDLLGAGRLPFWKWLYRRLP